MLKKKKKKRKKGGRVKTATMYCLPSTAHVGVLLQDLASDV